MYVVFRGYEFTEIVKQCDQCAESVICEYQIKKYYSGFAIQGSGVIKAGFAGDQVPKYHFPNL